MFESRTWTSLTSITFTWKLPPQFPPKDNFHQRNSHLENSHLERMNKLKKKQKSEDF